jgi:LL-diaminopimelate aminotransferase
MPDSYIQYLFADRIGGRSYGKDTEIYKFEKIKRAKRAAQAANPGAWLIDMGVGEPDDMAFPECVDALCKAAAKLDNRGYADNGGADYKASMASIRPRRFATPSAASRPCRSSRPVLSTPATWS